MSKKDIIILVGERNFDLLRTIRLLGDVSHSLHIIQPTREEREDLLLCDVSRFQKLELPMVKLSFATDKTPVDLLLELNMAIEKLSREALELQKIELPTIEELSADCKFPVDFQIEPKISFQKRRKLEQRRFKK